ncbi:MAG: hypothetical protein V4594_01500 [Bacteroidota bacterium]
MKITSFFFTASILLAATSVVSAQDKTDSIKVIYESQNTGHQTESPEYYVDSVLLKGVFIEAFKPTDIEKINVENKGKGKIYITLKKDVPYNFVSLQSLSNRYLKNKETNALLYTVDGKLVTAAESLINEKDILSVSIASDQAISSLPGGKVTILKVLTKSKLNIDNANRTYIRGNTSGSR